MECGWEIAGTSVVGKTSRSSSLMEEVILDQILDELLLDVFVDEPKLRGKFDEDSKSIDDYLDSLLPQDDESAPSEWSEVSAFGNEGEGSSPVRGRPQSTRSEDSDSIEIKQRQDSETVEIQSNMVESKSPDDLEVEREQTPRRVDLIAEAVIDPPELLHESENGPLKEAEPDTTEEKSVWSPTPQTATTDPTEGESVQCATSQGTKREPTAEESVRCGTSQDESSSEDREGPDTDCSIPKSITSNTCSGGSSGDGEENKAKSAPASVRASPIDRHQDLFGLSCQRDDCGGIRSMNGRHFVENIANPDCPTKHENGGWRGREGGQSGQPKISSPNSKTRSLFVDAIRELAKQQKAEMIARANEEKERLERIARQARAEREERLAKEKAARLEEERQKVAQEEEARKAREAEKQKAIQEAERLRLADENKKRKAAEKAAEEAEKRKVSRECVWRRVVPDTIEHNKQKKSQEEEGDKRGAAIKSSMERQCSGESRKSTSTAVWENDAVSDGGSDPFRRELEWGWSEEISEGEELIQTRRPSATDEKQQQTKDNKRVVAKSSSKGRPAAGKITKQDSVREPPVRRTDSGRNLGRVQNGGGGVEGPPKTHLTKSASKKAKRAKNKRRQQSERESVGSNESVAKESKAVTRSSSRSPVLVVPKGKVVRPGVSSRPAASTQTIPVKPNPSTAEPVKSSGLTAKRHPELVCTGTQTSVPAAPAPVATLQRPRPRYSITYKAAVQKAIVMESNTPPPPPESPPSPAPQTQEELMREMSPPLSTGRSPPQSPELNAPQAMSTPSPSQIHLPQMIPAFPPWLHYPPVGLQLPGMPTLPHPIQPYWTTYCGLFHPIDVCESEFPIPNEEDLWAGNMETQERELAFAKKCQPVLREEYQEMVAQGRHLPWRR